MTQNVITKSSEGHFILSKRVLNFFREKGFLHIKWIFLEDRRVFAKGYPGYQSQKPRVAKGIRAFWKSLPLAI